MSGLTFAKAALAALWRDRHANAESLRRLQRRLLVRLVLRARERVPLYRELYADLDAENFSLADLPRLDKATLMERLSESMDAPDIDREEIAKAASASAPGWLRGRYLVLTTSGTSGRVGVFVFDRSSWARQTGALVARLLRDRIGLASPLRFGPHRRYRMALLVATGGPFVSYALGVVRPPGARLFADVRVLSIGDTPESTVAALNRFRPHYLHAYSSFAQVLARESLEGRLRISPEVISLGSEPAPAPLRDLVQRAFPKCELLVTYGATECVAMANQCRYGRLHANTDLCVLEPVDDEGAPVSPGKVGRRLLVTNLLAWPQPIVRYEIDDRVVVDAEACPCGRPTPTVTVYGRADDTFYLRRGDGTWVVAPPIPFEALLLKTPGVRRFQLVHESQNRLVLRLVPEERREPDEVVAAARTSFAHWLRERRLDGSVEVVCETVAEIAPDPRSGKVRQIVSKVPPPGTGEEVAR